MGVSSLFNSCSLLVHVQSGRSKAADKTPMGDYFGKVSRKFKNVESWLNVFLAYFDQIYLNFRHIFIHCLPFSIFSTFLCFDGYFDNFAASVYDTVITGVAF